MYGPYPMTREASGTTASASYQHAIGARPITTPDLP
jgi:hypothetical protein